MSDDYRYQFPHQRTEQLATQLEWEGFVGSDNIDALYERVKAIVVPGRTFAISRNDDDQLRRPPRVDQGLTLWMGEAFRKPLELSKSEHGAGFSANMGPKLLGGFGVSVDTDFNSDTCETHVMTGREVRDAACDDIIGRDGKSHGRRRFGWCWVSIVGGLEGTRPCHDRITIIRENRDRYRELIDVVPSDIAWQQRFERDALTCDHLALLLQVKELDDYHPAVGVDRAEAEVAVKVIERMAVNVRRWREPLQSSEVYPVVKDMR